jgi:AcrR family transcriptional regulator
MRERARSADDKTLRSQALLNAAESLALELGGVRHVTVAAVADRAGLHRTGARRYYDSKEDLLLELAERGWAQWRDAVAEKLAGASGLDAPATADVLSDTIVGLPVFCDLLAHVPMRLEGDVDIERARRFKSGSFASHDEIVGALAEASELDPPQLRALIAAAVAFAAGFWQVAHPTPTLAELYAQVPEWGHVALDFHPRLAHLLRATAVGLAQEAGEADGR